MKRILVFLLCTAYGFSQENNNSVLTIKQIMQADAFVGHLPSSPRWSADSKDIYFDWNPEATFSDSLYVYNLKKATITKVGFETEYNLPSFNSTFNKKRTKKIYEKRGDIYIVDIASNSTIQVTRTEDYEKNVQFIENDTKIAFLKGDNIYTWNIDTGATTQLTNFTDVKEKKEDRNEKDEWLYNDQLALFDVLRERKAKADAREEMQQRYKEKELLVIDIDGKSIGNQNISPDGKYITYTTIKRANNKGTIMPHFVTESGYVEDETTRSKVGDEQTKYELFVCNITTKKTHPVVLDNLEGLDYIPEYTKDYPDKVYKNDDRIGYISGPIWSSDGKYAVLDISANDYKDRWIVLLNAEDGTVTNLDHQHDAAWIAGPGIGRGNLGWMPNDRSIWFQSEKTGYSHLYTIDVISKKTKALTAGSFEVYNPSLSNDKSRWYFTANKNHPGDRQFYTMPVQGGKLTVLTSMTW